MNNYLKCTSKSLTFILALMAIYLIWGTTYLAIHVAVESVPGLLMLSIRYLLAGAILYAFVRLRGTAAPKWNDWKFAAILGITVMGICNGTVSLIADRVPTGTISCVFATGPMILAIVSWVGGYRHRPGAWECLGMLAGFAGILMLTLYGSESSGSSFWPFGVLLVLATVSWAIGTVWTQHRKNGTSIMMLSAMQMLWGGAFSLCLSVMKGDLGNLSTVRVSGSGVFALIYLIVFGTIVAFVSYNFLLKTTRSSIVAAHAYVNPIVALVAGAVFLGEELSMVGFLSVVIILFAVFMNIWDPKLEMDREYFGRILSRLKISISRIVLVRVFKSPAVAFNTHAAKGELNEG